MKQLTSLFDNKKFIISNSYEMKYRNKTAMNTLAKQIKRGKLQLYISLHKPIHKKFQNGLPSLAGTSLDLAGNSVPAESLNLHFSYF